MATVKDKLVMFVRLSAAVISRTRARREYRDVRVPDCKENVAMPQGHARLVSVVTREFRNAFMCPVAMVSHVWLVLSVELVSRVNQGFRSVHLGETSRLMQGAFHGTKNPSLNFKKRQTNEIEFSG